MPKKNIMVAQSGGPTTAINASLAGVLDAACKSQEYDTVYGSLNGIMGILDDRILNLTEKTNRIPTDIEECSDIVFFELIKYKCVGSIIIFKILQFVSTRAKIHSRSNL